MSKEVRLSNGMLALVDDEDFERVSQCTWHWHVNKGDYARPVTTSTRKGKTKYTIMSRFIMNAQAGEVIDHRDRNTLNNQKSNLRRCTGRQNQWNRAADRDRFEVSGPYKGVTFVKRTKKNPFQAVIRANGKEYYLGCYATPELAAFAYDVAARILHGEFAYLNLPDLSAYTDRIVETTDYPNDPHWQ